LVSNSEIGHCGLRCSGWEIVVSLVVGKKESAKIFKASDPTRYDKRHCFKFLKLIPLRSEILCYPNLPLAVYREIAAHLQQLDGVVTEFLPPTHTQFDYAHSQVGGLQINYPHPLPSEVHQRLNAIIDFYGERYGIPQRSEVPMVVS
jgi:hypothetical protein